MSGFPHRCPVGHEASCAICLWLRGHRWGRRPSPISVRQLSVRAEIPLADGGFAVDFAGRKCRVEAIRQARLTSAGPNHDTSCKGSAAS